MCILCSEKRGRDEDSDEARRQPATRSQRSALERVESKSEIPYSCPCLFSFHSSLLIALETVLSNCYFASTTRPSRLDSSGLALSTQRSAFTGTPPSAQSIAPGQMNSLFNPRKAVHFALDPDDEDEHHLPPTTTSHLVNQATATSTQPTSSSPAAAYTDQPDSPLFDLDTEDDPLHHEPNYYPPQPLKSTYPSREAQFDLDSDDIDTDEHEQLEEPLMQGLLQKRISGERSRRGQQGGDIEYGGGTADEPPDWLTKGAGVFAGIANMSNSILGAGIIGEWLAN